MDFTFSAEQEALRDAVQGHLSRTLAPERVRRMIDDQLGFSEEWWAGITEMGWPGLMVPERLGGSGLGLIDAVVVQEEMGKKTAPGPFLSSAVCATLAALHLGGDDLLAQMASGRTRATVAIEEIGPGDPLASIEATGVPDGDEWVLSGAKPVVLDGHSAHVALVAARTSEGLATFVLENPGGELIPGLDVTRKVARLDLDRRRARRVGPGGDQTAILERIGDDIAVAVCAETVGACQRALEMAIEYAKARVQFDRPIASFQAIKHKIVDMLHQLELARVGTHWAAWTSQVDDPLRPAAAAMAKSFVGEAANMITAENIQVHGGVGFTWDVDCHLLFRRAKQNDVLFGRGGWQRQRLADLVIDGSSPPSH